MVNSTLITLLFLALFVMTRFVRADDASPNPVTHPVMAYDAHEVKAGEKDISKDETKMTETKQSVKERTDFRDQRKSEYEKSLKDNGADSDVTKQALAKYQEAEKSLKQSAHKHGKARHEMRKDENSLEHEKAELKEDRKVTAQ